MLATGKPLLEVCGVPARRLAPEAQRRRAPAAIKALALHALIALAWLLFNLRAPRPDVLPTPGLVERGPQVLEIHFAAPAAQAASPVAEGADPSVQESPVGPAAMRVAGAPAPSAQAERARSITRTAAPAPVAAPKPPVPPARQTRPDPAAERAMTETRPEKSSPAPASASDPASAPAAAGADLPGRLAGRDSRVSSSAPAGVAPTQAAPTRQAFAGGVRDDLPWAYRWKVKSALAQLRRYPRQAYAAEQQGTALVRIHLARSGELLDVSLLRSSGHALLDEEALAVVQRVGRFPALPDAVLPGLADFAIDQPIGFELRR